MHPLELVSEWRERAVVMRRHGAGEAASSLEACADDLEESWRIWQTEPITLEEASEESGYSYSHLQQTVASGEIPNIGEQGKPRVRRADLPRKTPGRRFELATGEPDLAAEILAGKF